MTKHDPWFFQERAFAFASLVLTERNDAIVQAHAGADRGIDLLVEVLKGGKPTLRFFGVQLVAFMDLPDIRNTDEQVVALLPRDPSEASFPICLFVIGVRKPEGICRWVVEPVVDDGRALLHRDGEPNWQVLDEAGAARLIGQVNEWYDALQGDLTPKRRDRRR